MKMTKEQEQFLEEMTFLELSKLLVDLYYRTGSEQETEARAWSITLDMVNAELHGRIYHTEYRRV